MTTGEIIAAEALTWAGTRVIMQQSCSVKGPLGGVDCKGLVAAIARACGRPEGNSIEALRTGYIDIDEVELKTGLQRLFDEVDKNCCNLGDILLIKVGGKAQHMGIVTQILIGRPIKFIHAFLSGPGVVTNSSVGHTYFDAIDSVWRWKASH